MPHPLRPVLLFLLALLCGCKADLYSQLPEREANRMLAILLEGGFTADRVAGTDGTVTLRVERGEVGGAIDLLRANGFPRDSFGSLGAIFKREGLISSPLEERARFMYALSQELSETISSIDGVIAARVHLVLPQQDQNRTVKTAAAAAVFVKHLESYPLDVFVPQIRTLVANSVEGLNPQNVTVVLSPSQPLPKSAHPDRALQSVLGIQVAADSVGRLWLLISGTLLLFGGALAAGGLWYWRGRRSAGLPAQRTEIAA